MAKTIVQIMPVNGSMRVVYAALKNKALVIHMSRLIAWALTEENNIQGAQRKQSRSVEGVMLYKASPILISDLLPLHGATFVGYEVDGVTPNVRDYPAQARKLFDIDDSEPEPEAEPEPETEMESETEPETESEPEPEEGMPTVVIDNGGKDKELGGIPL